jgi:pantothenate kinase
MTTASDLLDTLATRAEKLSAQLPPGRRLLLGIAGAPGSGKSTLAAALATRLGGERCGADATVVNVPMDGFHLADSALDQLGLRDRKGAPETFDALGYAALLQRIAAGEPVWAPAFERDLEQPLAQSIAVTAATTAVISEGNYLLLPDPPWQAARAHFAEVWYCRVDDDLRRKRLVERHVRFGKPVEAARAWVASVDEPNAALVAATASSADLVVDLTGVIL